MRLSITNVNNKNSTQLVKKKCTKVLSAFEKHSNFENKRFLDV
jgi:hypothetical protein